MIHQDQIECSACETKCLVKKCHSEYIALASEHKRQFRYDKDQSIFLEGSNVSGMYFVQRGQVKVVSKSISGKEQIVRLASDGHLLGHRGYGGEIYPVGAITLTYSSVCFLDNKVLFDLFKSNFLFLYKMMMFYSEELRKSELRNKYFAQMTVEQKIIYALVYIVDTFEKQTNVTTITLSRQNIASIVGTNNEQVSRTLTFLKKENIIQIELRNIIVSDLSKLKQLITDYLI